MGIEQEDHRPGCATVLVGSEDKNVCTKVSPVCLGALNANSSVPVTIQGGPPEAVIKTLPKHKKNPEVGEKKSVYSSSILIDQDDALSFEDNEEVRWFYQTHGMH